MKNAAGPPSSSLYTINAFHIRAKFTAICYQEIVNNYETSVLIPRTIVARVNSINEVPNITLWTGCPLGRRDTKTQDVSANKTVYAPIMYMISLIHIPIAWN